MTDFCKIRLANYSDIDDMAKLLGLLFEIEIDFKPDYDLQVRGLSIILDNPLDAMVLVAEVEREVVGMCVLHKRISTYSGSYAGVLEDLIVKPEFRGKGIGSILLKTAEEKALKLGWKNIHLLMDKNNLDAEGFYLSHGWEKTSLVCLRKTLI